MNSYMNNQFNSFITEITEEFMEDLEDLEDINKIFNDKDSFNKYSSLIQTKINSKIKTESLDKDKLHKEAEEFIVKNKDNPILQDVHKHYIEKKSPIKPPQKEPLNLENISDTYKTLMKDMQKETINQLSNLENLEDIETMLQDKEILTKLMTTLAEKMNKNIDDNKLDINVLLSDLKKIINNNLTHPILGDYYKQINVTLDILEAKNIKLKASSAETGSI